HYLAYQRSSRATVGGFATRDSAKQRGDWRDIKGNFGPPGQQINIEGLTIASTIEELLTDDSLDLIDICLPPHLHAQAIEKALAAGKFVLCEKPLALSSFVAKRLLEQATPGRLMVAHILPFMPEFCYLVEAHADARFGAAISGRFHRTIGPPDWLPDFYDTSRVGGPLIDLQVHDAHLIRLLFGMPQSANSVSHLIDGVPSRYETIFQYSNDFERPVVAVGGGVTNSPAREFTHGYEVSFERATVRFEFAGYQDGSTSGIPLTVLHADGQMQRPVIESGDPVDAFVAEIEAAADAVEGRPLHPALDPTIAVDALTICEMQMPDSVS
ncbi:MAG: Gfo/Idh/MocA family oxidoreductase, partial [Planctomycetota bacterium]